MKLRRSHVSGSSKMPIIVGHAGYIMLTGSFLQGFTSQTMICWDAQRWYVHLPTFEEASVKLERLSAD